MHEARAGVVAPVTRAVTSLAPLLLTAVTLVAGVMPLISGATPATPEATELLLQEYFPLPLVEASHFLGSVAGLGLLFVARGMLLRLDAAWWAGLLLTSLSIVLAFPKGFAVTEAAVLALLATVLALSRKQFTRKASLLAQPFTSGWLIAILGILTVIIGLIFFVYRDVEYVHELWWQFEFDGHASRALRATVAVGLLTFILALRQLLRPAVTAHKPGASEIEQAAALTEKGVPVAGFDSLRYFWTARTPEGLSSDLDRVLKYYADLWKRSRVILIGYSQGANVLAFALNRLPPETRSLVGQTVLMGLHDKASFEFHLGNCFEDGDEGIPLLPEMVKLGAESPLCVYGEDEEDSFCPRMPAGHVQAVSLPGGHHFDGDYDRLAELILAWSQKPEGE
ncbi:MAG: hypothetical protein EXR08_00585 [Alphaproteobacteria bacterium]|nr:hypothetical protein [Alphaproteobacteria bacterium]